MIWLACDMDDGVIGAFRTKRDAIEQMCDAKPHVKRCASGDYEVRDVWGRDDFSQFWVMTEPVARRHGFDWAIDRWEAAGRPIGKRTP